MFDSATNESQEVTNQAELDQLEAELQRRLKGHVRDLQLALSGTGIVLRGQAYSFYAKQLAQQGVMQGTDLPIERNAIQVI